MCTIADDDVDDAKGCLDSQTCSGADVPQELFDLIADFIVLQVNTRFAHEDELQIVSMSKHDVCNCALTCRYWTELYLPTAFERLKITSREELLQLAELVSSPHSHIRLYLRTVELVSVDGKPPWIHHAPPILNALPLESREELQYTLVLEGPPPNSTEQPPLSIRSIHQSVPRRMPSTMSPFDMLELSNVHFRSFNDLLRLVGELPVLTQLILDRVTWTTLPDAIPVVRGRPRLLYMVVSAVEAYWPFVRLFAGSKHEAHDILPLYSPSPIDPLDLRVLDRLYRCIFAGVPSDVRDGDTDVISEAKFTCVKYLQQTRLEGRVWAQKGRHYRRSFASTHEENLALTPDLQVIYEPLDPSSTESTSAYAHIIYLAVDLRGFGLPFEQAIERDWTQFDEASSSMPFLRGVSIGLYSPQDVREFARQKGELFSNLRAGGKLVFGHWDLERRLWYPEGVDHSKTPGAGVNELWKLHLRRVP